MAKPNLNNEKYFYENYVLKNLVTVDTKNGVITDKFNKQFANVGTAGYIRIPVIDDNYKSFTVASHRVIWIVENGLITDPNLVINHKNAIKTDNRIENLELITHAQNIKHAYDIGAIRDRKGENHPASKLKDQDVINIRLAYNNKEKSSKELAEIYKCTQRNIQDILCGHVCPHLPYANPKKEKKTLYTLFIDKVAEVIASGEKVSKAELARRFGTTETVIYRCFKELQKIN